MYYEEKIIDDVLCTRGTPGMDFIPLSQVALTARCLSLRAERDEAVALLTKVLRYEELSGEAMNNVSDFLAKYS